MWVPRDLLIGNVTERSDKLNAYNVDIEHFCAAVVHPDTGETITQYKKLANDNNTEVKETWMTAFGKEVGRLAQGDNKTKTSGKNCMFIMNHEKIKDMYAREKKSDICKGCRGLQTPKGGPEQSKDYSGRQLNQIPRRGHNKDRRSNHN